MTKREGKAVLVDLKALLAADEDYLRTMVEAPRRASGRRRGWATAAATTAAR